MTTRRILHNKEECLGFQEQEKEGENCFGNRESETAISANKTVFYDLILRLEKSGFEENITNFLGKRVSLQGFLGL